MAYGACSAIKVALVLAEAFNCGVNDLPLTGYIPRPLAAGLLIRGKGYIPRPSERYKGYVPRVQHLTRTTYLVPFRAGYVDFLMKQFNIKPISTPQKDLAEIVG
jgi:hydroxylamine reductase